MAQEDERRAGEGPLNRRGVRTFRCAALTLGAALAALCAGSAAARDDKDSTRSSYEQILVSTAQRRGVDRAIDWIAAHQQRSGRWGSPPDGTYVADTALSVLALMAAGNTVGPPKPIEEQGRGEPTLRGPYAEHVRAAIAYLAKRAWSSPNGYIYDSDDTNSRMHGHGFATLALAEASGNLGPTDIGRIRGFVLGKGGDPTQMSLADQVRWALERAVECTQRAQDQDTGGWGYSPQPDRHEGSMTVTQIAALRAASDRGVRVSREVMSKAYDYIRRSQNVVAGINRGGFAYELNMRERVSYGLTAAALTTFYGLGKYGQDRGDREVIRLGFEYMDRNAEEPLNPRAQFFYYNLFYGAQALYQSADERRITRDWPRIRAALLEQQLRDGSFEDCGPENDPGGIEYSTAIATLTLQVPMETLPIFQRR